MKVLYEGTLHVVTFNRSHRLVAQAARCDTTWRSLGPWFRCCLVYSLVSRDRASITICIEEVFVCVLLFLRLSWGTRSHSLSCVCDPWLAWRAIVGLGEVLDVNGRHWFPAVKDLPNCSTTWSNIWWPQQCPTNVATFRGSAVNIQHFIFTSSIFEPEDARKRSKLLQHCSDIADFAQNLQKNAQFLLKLARVLLKVVRK